MVRLNTSGEDVGGCFYLETGYDYPYWYVCYKTQNLYWCLENYFFMVAEIGES